MKKGDLDTEPLIEVPAITLGPLRISQHLEKKVLFLIGVSVLAYMFWMDIALYGHVVNRLPGQKPGKHRFHPFEDLTPKVIMSDPLNHYVLFPSSFAFVEATHLEKTIFTPNVVTTIHLIFGAICARLIFSDSLALRRVGVIFSFFRMWLDDLDGMIARAAKSDAVIHSETGSAGSYYDMIADMTEGGFLVVAIAFLVVKQKPKDYKQLLPLWRSSSNQMLPDTSEAVSKLTIMLRTFWFAILLALSGVVWNREVTEYSDVLMKTDISKDQQLLQNKIFTSTTYWIISWFWRLFNGNSVTLLALVAVFLDRIWEFLVLFQYVGTVILTLLILATEIHLIYSRTYCGIPVTTSSLHGLFLISWVPIVAIPLYCILKRCCK